MLSVIIYKFLQSQDIEPVPISRDVEQGQVIDHTTAQPKEVPRNSLEESARIVRGNVRDLRNIDVENLRGAILVGGGGTLHTWLDYHSRGKDCRITERLKYHLLDFIRQSKPILCLDNTFLVIAFILKEQGLQAQMNPGENSTFRELISDWGMALSDEYPCYDQKRKIGSLPDLIEIQNLGVLENQLNRLWNKLES